jgi:murein L,D-transpeptidase YcbB/YkuD
MEIVGEGAAARFRQRPGPKNALGNLKFVLPNAHNIYLHDTPADSLFARRRRTLSHGCVRVEQPLELAVALMGGDPEENRKRLEAEIARGENRALRLPEPVPVHIVYWTSWVDSTGTLQFRADPYGVDEKLARALEFGASSRTDGRVRVARSRAG